MPFDPDHLSARYFVQSLERGLAVMRAFGRERPRLTVAEVARETGLTSSAARRLLLTLRDLGYVGTDGRYFQLRPRAMELGYAYLSSLALPDIALPHVEQLVTRIEESSEMAILDGEEIVYVLRVPGPQLLTMSVSVGARMPAHATSLGRALLAGLDDAVLEEYLASATLVRYSELTITDPRALERAVLDARSLGYATVDQELEVGLVAVAVPIRDASGRITSALNVSTNIARRSLRDLKREALPELLATSAAIEADLNAAPAPR